MACGRMVRDACRVRGQMNADHRISQRFWFEHQSGKRLYPYKLRDLRSGRVAFRVAPGAAGANKVENQTQIDNEEEVFRHVFGLGWSVRMRSLDGSRSEEHTSELQSLMRISYAVFCLKKKIQKGTK